MRIKRFNEAKRGGTPIIKPENAPISKEEIVECFQDYQDHVSGFEINSMFTQDELMIRIIHDDVVDSTEENTGNPTTVDTFKRTLESQNILSSCIDRFESMYGCEISHIRWGTQRTDLKFTKLYKSYVSKPIEN